jgi:hypothetical protein
MASGIGGLLSWSLISLSYKKHRLNLALTLVIFLLPLGMIVRYLFFSSHEDNTSSWGVLLQYGAVVYTVIFGLTWVFRNRIQETVLKRDAEQALGADSP